jgi:transposase-like protein
MKTIQLQSKPMPKQAFKDINGTEGARRTTGGQSMAGTSSPSAPSPADPEVSEKKPRRKYTAAYKLRILKEYEACTVPGEIGALLRREGLYHSNVNTWLRQRDKGALHGLTPRKRGRKSKKVNPLAREVANLERENKKLAEKLHKAETIIEVQKKISEILGISQNNSGETN